MSSLLVLKQIGKSITSATTQKYYGNLLQLTSSTTPVQRMATKIHSSQTSTQSATTEAANNNEEWRIIYRLPLIRLASAFNHVKVPYGMLNCVIITAAYALEQASQLPPTTTLLIGSVGVTSWCTLAISSLFIKNLIGIIYINNSNDKLKLAYVDYWGKRHDVCIELDDLIPESEKSKPAKFDFYQSLNLYSDDKVKFKLLQRFGLIEDPGTFASIFGE